MRPVIFQLAGINIYSYGFFVSLGIIFAVLYLWKRVQREGGSPETVIDLTLVIVLSGIIGARLAYILLYDTSYYLRNPLKIFMLQEGGLAFYGAFVFGFLTAILYLRKKGIPVLFFLDMASPAVALGYGIARIGCFLNGCCYGKPTTILWGVVFPCVDGLRRHPTQLYSLLAAVLIFAFLVWKTQKGVCFQGQIFSLFLILYGLSRSVIELFRENNQLVGGASTASLAALALASVGSLLYFYLRQHSAAAVSPKKSAPPGGNNS